MEDSALFGRLHREETKKKTNELKKKSGKNDKKEFIINRALLKNVLARQHTKMKITTKF